MIKLTKKLHVYGGKIFDLFKTEYEIDGKKIIREEVEKEDSITILLLNQDNQVYVQKEFRSPLNKIVDELPAGIIHYNKAPVQTARERLAEETGYLIDESMFKRIGIYSLSAGFTNEKSHVFVAKLKTGKYRKVNKKQDEDGTVSNGRWISFNSAKKKITSASGNLALMGYELSMLKGTK